jgi:hypothetical protein
MKYNPFLRLIESRRFWLTLLDLIISTVAYVLSTYASPDATKTVMWLITAWQPVIISIIIAYTVENAAEIKSFQADK